MPKLPTTKPHTATLLCHPNSTSNATHHCHICGPLAPPHHPILRSSSPIPMPGLPIATSEAIHHRPHPWWIPTPDLSLPMVDLATSNHHHPPFLSHLFPSRALDPPPPPPPACLLHLHLLRQTATTLPLVGLQGHRQPLAPFLSHSGQPAGSITTDCTFLMPYPRIQRDHLLVPLLPLQWISVPISMLSSATHLPGTVDRILPKLYLLYAPPPSFPRGSPPPHYRLPLGATCATIHGCATIPYRTHDTTSGKPWSCH